MSGANIWVGRTEHHLSLVAAAQLLKTTRFLRPGVKGIRAVVRDEVVETRDLLEHWEGNQWIFGAQPRPKEPDYPSGKAFAGRNPDGNPYMAWGHWDQRQGPMLTPNVPASELRAVIDTVERQVVSARPDMARFVPHADPNAPAPWLRDDHGIWPHPDLLTHPEVVRQSHLAPATAETTGLHPPSSDLS